MSNETLKSTRGLVRHSATANAVHDEFMDEEEVVLKPRLFTVFNMIKKTKNVRSNAGYDYYFTILDGFV